MSKIVSANDYKGRKAFEVYDNPESDVRSLLKDKLEKGLIDESLYKKAIDQLDILIEKGSKGEGSKGGHVIGHTKSGKPVYAKGVIGKEGKKDELSSQDHKDAAEIHREKAHKHDRASVTLPYGDAMRMNHESLRKHHDAAAQYHEKNAAVLGKKEAQASLSDDEKKVIADKKKKLIEHHQQMHNFHKKQAQDIVNEHGDWNSESKLTSYGQALKEEHDRHVSHAFHHLAEKQRLEKE